MNTPAIKLPSLETPAADLFGYWNALIQLAAGNDSDSRAILIEQAKLAMLTKIAIELEALKKIPAR